MPADRFSLVSLLGKSPGTVHTTLCLLELVGYRIDELHIIATEDSSVAEALEILWSCPCKAGGQPPGPRLREVEVAVLDFSDVRNKEDLHRLRLLLSRLLSTSSGVRSILDVSGGRKVMAVAAALEALRLMGTGGPEAVFSSIIPDNLYQRLRSARELCEKTAPGEARLIRLA